ncbi:MAG TPA: glycosyltransferase family 4 protein [Burkholderiales bacterium]|nr:glycosyltransferase family 4 protein [Burkholderiales bacterium]
MRIAFYAPLKSPTHGTPSGDRRVAGLLLDALRLAGVRAEVASTFRSFDGEGSAERQLALRRQGEALGVALADGWRARAQGERPQLWFTYHLYYKAPDWLGPVVSAELGIPYVVAEASHAAKRAHGAWAIGHEATVAAIRQAALIVSPSRDDIAGLTGLVEPRRILYLPPFLDVAPYAEARGRRAELRAGLASEQGLDPALPWIVVAAMMRVGDKLASYRSLADALAYDLDLPWQLVIAGDGPARAQVENALERSGIGERARLLGALPTRRLAEVFAACDVCAWPAVNEAYGMALLEAQAAGVPVVSCATRGVPDVVIDGRTGVLVPYADEAALAAAIRSLVEDAARRRALGEEAARFVCGERSIASASQALSRALAAL